MITVLTSGRRSLLPIFALLFTVPTTVIASILRGFLKSATRGCGGRDGGNERQGNSRSTTSSSVLDFRLKKIQPVLAGNDEDPLVGGSD